MSKYYTGVPVGGTIMFLGGLVGQPIPDNFVDNSTFVYAGLDPRKSTDLAPQDLPFSEGMVMLGKSSVGVELETGEDTSGVQLTTSHVPKIQKTMAAANLPYAGITATDAGKMWTISDNTNKNTNYATTEPYNGSVLWGNMQTLFSNESNKSWSYDHQSAYSGSTRTYWSSSDGFTFWTRQVDQSNGQHTHTGPTNIQHSHTLPTTSIGLTKDTGTINFNTSTQTNLYRPDVFSNSKGARFITRIY